MNQTKTLKVAAFTVPSILAIFLMIDIQTSSGKTIPSEGCSPSCCLQPRLCPPDL